MDGVEPLPSHLQKNRERLDTQRLQCYLLAPPISQGEENEPEQLASMCAGHRCVGWTLNCIQHAIRASGAVGFHGGVSSTQALPRTRLELLMENPQHAVELFRKLDRKTKAEMWTDKLDEVRALECWTPEQAYLLDEAVDLITPNLFGDEGSSATRLARSNAFEWLESALKAFPPGELGRIVATLHPYAEFIPFGGTGACMCNTSIHFCITGCDEGGCVKSDSGCGFFGLQQCNGVCNPPI